MVLSIISSQLLLLLLLLLTVYSTIKNLGTLYEQKKEKKAKCGSLFTTKSESFNFGERKNVEQGRGKEASCSVNAHHCQSQRPAGPLSHSLIHK